MDVDIYCLQSFCNFNESSESCTYSFDRTSNKCTGEVGCEGTCTCRGCDETWPPTQVPTTHQPTMEPSLEPSHSPTVTAGKPTSHPVTPLPTVVTTVSLSIEEEDGTDDFNFNPKSTFEIVATLDDYEGIYFDSTDDSLFIWECMNCGSEYQYFNDLVGDDNDYITITNEQTEENGAVTSTLTLNPEPGDICTDGTIVTSGILEEGKTYTIRFTAIAYSSVHAPPEDYTYEYYDTIRLNVNQGPQNVTCWAEPPEGTCFSTSFVFQCNENYIYTENGYGSIFGLLSYQWILYSRDHDYFAYASEFELPVSSFSTDQVCIAFIVNFNCF